MVDPRTIHTLPGEAAKRSNATAFSQLWHSIPPVTRSLLVSALLVTVLMNFQVLSPMSMVFIAHATLFKAQIWRLYTSCLIMPAQPMSAVLELYNLYSRSNQLEKNHFNVPGRSRSVRNSIDYIYYLTFCATLTACVSSLYYGSHYPCVFTSAFIGAITYTWSLDNADEKILLYGILPVTGRYFPLIHLSVSFIYNDSTFFITFCGVCVGYVYTCLDTNTFGPIWGYISRKKDPLYGKGPSGKFKTPGWFISICEFILRLTAVFDRRGKRDVYNSRGNTTSSSSSSSTTNNSNGRSSRESKPEPYAGKGQRLGNNPGRTRARPELHRGSAHRRREHPPQENPEGPVAVMYRPCNRI